MLEEYTDIRPVAVQSAYGDLYFATRKTDNLGVAIKVNKDLSDSGRSRFMRENDILHRLMEHDNIIQPITRILTIATGIGQQQNEYYVMKKADASLLQWLYEERAKKIENKKALFEQICIGLKHAHESGYTHRDLHTGNVLVEYALGDTVKLIDFGRAYDFNSGALLSTSTPAWGWLVMPPEIRFGTIESPDSDTYEKGDIFALGLIWMFLFSTSTDPVGNLRKIEMEMYDFMNPDLSPYEPQNFQPYYTLTDIEQRRAKFDEWILQKAEEATKSFQVLLLNVELGDQLTVIARKLIAFNPDERFNSIDDVLNALNSMEGI